MGSPYRYIAIDLKSFYASVECRERGLDPLTANLVVADQSRTEKTICLAVSPSLKAYGIGGRARLFEVIQRVAEVNRTRPPDQQLTYITAKPRMALYLDYSARVYEVYLRHFAPEDIHVYSIDEVFIDVAGYLRTRHTTARELASQVVRDILETTGITATAGIGTNLYLAKVAMDMLAKHEEPDENGVRIAELNEETYRRRLWSHLPITDFWRVGPGTARRLASRGMHTMGDVARASLGRPGDRLNEGTLFELFGKNAELLIDHAWGVEPVEMRHIKAYRPSARSKVSGQVLHSPYAPLDARLVAWEMAEQLALDLMAKHLLAGAVVLTVGYDRESFAPGRRMPNDPHGEPLDLSDVEVTVDRYGRAVPKHAHGTRRFRHPTASAKQMASAVLELFDVTVDERLLVRRLTIAAEGIVDEVEAARAREHEQLTLFEEDEDAPNLEELERERKRQQAMLDIRAKFGKNAVLKAASLQDQATARQRNNQIGGHSA